MAINQEFEQHLAAGMPRARDRGKPLVGRKPGRAEDQKLESVAMHEAALKAAARERDAFYCMAALHGWV